MGRTTTLKRQETQYAALEPRVHYVSEAAVKKKWKKMTTSSQQNVQQVIASVKEQSSVRDGARSKRKADVTDAAIDELATR